MKEVLVAPRTCMNELVPVIGGEVKEVQVASHVIETRPAILHIDIFFVILYYNNKPKTH